LKNSKISLSSIDYLVLARELSSELRGSWVDNVYQHPDYGYYLLKFRVEGVVKRLVAIPGEVVFLTKHDYPVPEKPSPSTMRLRKLLQNLRVDDVVQHGFDRIIVMSLSRGDLRVNLIIECLKRGVMVLVSSDGRILFTSHRLKTGTRLIREGEKYVFPPSNVIDPREKEEIEDFVFSSERLDRFIAGRLGFGSKIAREVCVRTGLDPGSEAGGKIQMIIDAARMLVKEAEEKPRPRIYYSNGSPTDVSSIFLLSMKDVEQKDSVSLSEAVDEYYAATGFEKLRVAEDFSKELENLLKIREEVVSKAGSLRLKAKTLMDNLILFQKVLESIKEGKEPPNEVRVVSVDYGKRIAKVVFNEVEYELDLDSSATSNASSMFEEAKRIEEHVPEIERKITAIKEKIPISRKMVPKKTVEKKWYEKFRWNISINGNLILAGKDAGTNELLVKKYVVENSIVLHADFIGAPFVTIYGIDNPSQEELEEAALMAACYATRAWDGKYASLDIYWVRGSQISKKAPPGQYLPRGAFMIHGSKNFIRNVELKLWVGVTEDGEVVYGSLSKVKVKCKKYVCITPGYGKKDEEAARLVKKFFGKETSRKKLIELIQSIRSIIPGKSCEIHYMSQH
jgi:predicted ribosome quality control (RQC) complex YloA/Tae2 family protein